MFDIKKAKVGDVLQHRVKGKRDYVGRIINFFSMGNKKNNYAHTAIYVGNGYKAEAHAGSVFQRSKIDKKEYKYIDGYRLPGGFSTKQKEDMLVAVGRMYGKEYDDIGLVGTVRSPLGKIFNWGWLRNSKPFFNDPKKFFCSEAINRIYADASKKWERGQIDLNPHVSEEATQPNDISRAGVVLKVY